KSKEDSEKAEVSLTSQELAAAFQNFKAQPSDLSWGEFFKTLRTLLSQPAVAHLDPQALIKLNPCLTELGAKVIAAGRAQIWSFRKVEQSQSLLIGWTESKQQVVAAGRRRKKVVAVPVARLEQLTPPPGVVLKDARLFDLAVAGEKAGKPERGRFLI